jgi:para-nitrobenzyl esterase
MSNMLLTILTLAALSPASWASSITSTVMTSYGPVRGNVRNTTTGVLSFKGISYATPPMGDLRWTSPKEPTPWTTPANAATFGNSCFSFSPTFGTPQGNQSEDCLKINVWTAARDTTELRPVMVFIHGGGLQFGSGADPTYDGTEFAANGVVLVNFNYRLGVFGFLALPELDLEGFNSGNYGIQDQIFALQWVKKNAAAFGGDPNKITVFGESAGALSVGIIVSSFLARGSFDKAIMESGALSESTRGSITTFDVARVLGGLFLKVFNASSVTQIRAIPPATIAKIAGVNQLTGSASVLPPYSASIDDYVLLAAPPTIWDSGEQAHVPLLMGWNHNEGYIFAGNALPHNSAAQFKQYLPLYFGNKTQEALTFWPANNNAQANISAVDLVGDLTIRGQVYEGATLQVKTGNSPVHVYYFTYTSPFSPVAIHTAELPYVFGSLYPASYFQGSKSGPDAADKAFSRKIQRYWINFANSSNPNGDGLPNWPTYKSGGSNILELGTNIQPTTYDVSPFDFINSFRVNGVLPTSWAAINVSETNP